MIKISPGNSKLGSIMNTSVRPVLDCAKNVPCKKDCYALKAWKQYPATRQAWTHNSNEWTQDCTGSRDNIIHQLKAKKTPPKYFRIHVAGDFINQRHLDAWKYIASKCPETKFRAFTKRQELDYGDCPDNLMIGFSMWPGAKVTIPKHINFTAWVQDGTEDRIPGDARLCKNDCSKCKYCWDVAVKDVYFKIH
jgi:hypothetical protein